MPRFPGPEGRQMPDRQLGGVAFAHRRPTRHLLHRALLYGGVLSGRIVDMPDLPPAIRVREVADVVSVSHVDDLASGADLYLLVEPLGPETPTYVATEIASAT
jgi:hypothetical protein